MTDQFVDANKMMPITPPPELVEQWRNEWIERREPSGWVGYYLATQAARWGADQELGACCAWLIANDNPRWALALQEGRRPKPPSLKERALQAWAAVEAGTDDQAAMAVIRRALEQLDD